MDLRAVWDALPRNTVAHGWQAIRIHPEASFSIKAGVHLPEGAEGLLLEVPAECIPAGVEYPEGNGFEVRPERLGQSRASHVRLCFTRTGDGNRDLFAILAEDVATRVASQADASMAVHALLLRIRMWQAFLRRHVGARLSDAEETGLVGELLFLTGVLAPNSDIAALVDSWQGPLGGLHDFSLGNASIEVKASLGRETVRISSLDQLDDRHVAPLFLAALVLRKDAGRTLPELVDDVRALVRDGAPTHAQALEDRVLSAGYIDAHAGLYECRFAAHSVTVYRVAEAFPRLTRDTVPAGITEGCYDVALPAAAPFRVETDVAVREFMGASSGTQ